MFIIGLFAAIGMIGSIFSIAKRSFLFAIGTSMAWFMLIVYTRQNTIALMPHGGIVDTFFISICVAFCLGTMLSIFVLNNKDEKEKQEKFFHSSEYRSEQDINRNNAQGSSYESADEYQARLARISRRRNNSHYKRH